MLRPVMKIEFLWFLFLKKDQSPPFYVHEGIPNNSKSACNAVLQSFAFHIYDSCFPAKALGYRNGLLWFITEEFKIRQSNYRPDSPQHLQSAKFKKCKILTRSDKYIMRELLKCKLPAFWYFCGVQHRTPESASSPSLPLTLCWFWGSRGKWMGRGITGRRMGPHITGAPKDRQWLHGNGTHCHM